MTQLDIAFYAMGVVLPGPTSPANATGQIPVWNDTGWDSWLGTWDGTRLTLPATDFTGTHRQALGITGLDVVTSRYGTLAALSNLLQLNASSYVGTAIVGLGANAYGPEFDFIKSRSTDGVSFAAVQDGDYIGFFDFVSDKGNGLTSSAAIWAEVSGSGPYTTYVPGKINLRAYSASGTSTNLTIKPLGIVEHTNVSGVTTFTTDTSGNHTITPSGGVLTVAGQVATTSSTQAWVDASDGATITFNLAAGNKQRVTMGGNRTLAISNVTVGQVFLLRLLSDGTGRTATWFSTIKWAGGSAPTQTATANKADVFGFICTSAGNYDGFVVGQNL